MRAPSPLPIPVITDILRKWDNQTGKQAVCNGAFCFFLCYLFMPKLSECLEEAGVLVVVMIPLHLLTPVALPLCDSWGRRGWGCVCCPCSCLSAFYSPTANHSNRAASISNSPWRLERGLGTCFGKFLGGRRNGWTLTVFVRAPQ